MNERQCSYIHPEPGPEPLPLTVTLCVCLKLLSDFRLCVSVCLWCTSDITCNSSALFLEVWPFT